MKSIVPSEIFKLALCALKGALKFYFIMLVFIIPLNVCIAWYEDNNVAAFLTLDFWVTFFTSPLTAFLILMLFLWLFISLLIAWHKDRKVT